VYAAEDQWSALLDRGGRVDFFGSQLDIPPQRRFGDIDSVRRYVEVVMGLPFITDDYPGAGSVTVRERSGQARAHYEPHSLTIAVPMRSRWAARESVVLHEIAHHLACSLSAPPDRRDWHGTRFRQAMCGLVQAVLGVEAALLLRAGYEESGLRTVAPA
jgi:putative metallohydrolase (TIGR04338 family)